jgi:hypothetical protein
MSLYGGRFEDKDDSGRVESADHDSVMSDDGESEEL